MWYLKVYSGRSKRARECIIEKLEFSLPEEESNKLSIVLSEVINDLESENIIRLIPYSEMTSEQKDFYDFDKWPIYEIIIK